GWRDHFHHWFRDGFYRRSFYHSLHGTRPASGGTCCSCRSHGYRLLPAGRVTSSRNLRLSLVLTWALSFRIAPRPNYSVLSQSPIQQRTGNRNPTTSCAPRSCDRCACSPASSCPTSGMPMVSAGDCPSRGLLHFRMHHPP